MSVKKNQNLVRWTIWPRKSIQHDNIRSRACKHTFIEAPKGTGIKEIHQQPSKKQDARMQQKPSFFQWIFNTHQFSPNTLPLDCTGELGGPVFMEIFIGSNAGGEIIQGSRFVAERSEKPTSEAPGPLWPAGELFFCSIMIKVNHYCPGGSVDALATHPWSHLQLGQQWAQAVNHF